MSNLLSIKQRFGVVGSSKLLDAALDAAVRVAASDLSVLIIGESGVGKEVFSKIIHTLSARKHNDFIAINCGAIPEGTINSELFGHEKGSFTGALGERKGYFETVNGGTIFLDEIGEMPLDTQAFLLRVLESGEFIRVGSSKVEKTNVRVVAATNVDLEQSVRNGKFREDLYYRLSTVPIKVPALRERREDINILFRKFVHDFCENNRIEPVRLDDRAKLVMENYPWPGNIRELKNIAERLCIMSEARHLSAEMLHEVLPHLFERNMPTAAGGRNAKGNDFQEREILYKLLFDMKSDLNDLKKLIFELIRNNNLRMPDFESMRQLQTPALPPTSSPSDFRYNTGSQDTPNASSWQSESSGGFYQSQSPNSGNKTPFYLDNHPDLIIEKNDVPESPITMDEIEKEAIKNALKKYNNRRKEVAEELQISERTLYRKIKQYDL